MTYLQKLDVSKETNIPHHRETAVMLVAAGRIFHRKNLRTVKQRQRSTTRPYGSESVTTHTCSNAVIRLMWRDVVDAVMFPWQHQMPVLKQRDPAWEAEVGVAPLMNLIGQRHKNRQSKDKAVPGVGRRQGLWKVTGHRRAFTQKKKRIKLNDQLFSVMKKASTPTERMMGRAWEEMSARKREIDVE